MTDPDQLKPYHAKDAAPGQEAADVVAEVLQHAQQREEAARKKVTPKGPPKWMLPLTVNLGVLALYFLIAQPNFLVMRPLDDPRPEATVVQDLKRAMYIDGVFRIQRFQSETGRLPESLAELGTSLGDQGVQYTVQGDSTYLLIATVGDETIVYDSQTTDPAEFVGTIQLPG